MRLVLEDREDGMALVVANNTSWVYTPHLCLSVEGSLSSLQLEQVNLGIRAV